MPAARGRRPTLSVPLRVGLLVCAVWAMRLRRLHRSVEGYARHWSQPCGEHGGLLYIALGDSAAQGIGASDPDHGYVGLLAERLRQSTGRPVRVVNLSRSGAKIVDVVRDQLPELAGRSPDLVTVDIGGNDIRRYDTDAYRRDVTALVEGLPSGAVIADIPFFMHGRFERDANAAAQLITAQAEKHGLRVACLHEAMRARGWGAMLTDYAADWFHPNDAGHRIWAQAFWEALPPELR